MKIKLKFNPNRYVICHRVHADHYYSKNHRCYYKQDFHGDDQCSNISVFDNYAAALFYYDKLKYESNNINVGNIVAITATKLDLSRILI